jgi:hypothetical protein
MFKSLAGRARAVATTGLIAALVVAGLAVAQGGNGNSGKSHHRKALSGKRMPPPPGGPIGKFGKDLTYAEVHVQHEGKAETVRIDAGEVVSTSGSSITVKENDGSEVTISVDDETKVLAGPGKETAVTDLKEGQHVIVCGPEGEAAKTIAVPPKRGQMRGGPEGSSQGSGQQGQFGPPPGPQGAPGQMQG